VLLGIAAGILLGALYPSAGAAMKPVGDGFIKLIRMIIAPIVFVTVVGGIARMQDMKELGRIGLRALIYFEVVSTGALIIGMIVAELLQPGAGINADPSSLDPRAVATLASTPREPGAVGFFVGLIPTTVVDAFARGDILQVMVFSILFGLALLKAGERCRPLVVLIGQIGEAFFAFLALIMRAAPIGAFGAMAFTVGAYGLPALLSLGKLVAAVYTTCLAFVFLVLGPIASLAGFSIWRFLKYIKEEIFITIGMSNSEVVLPRMLGKLERLGADRRVVGLVIPTGYSFNQDGSAIYQTMGALFIAQALNIPLSWTEKLTILGVLMVTSKGAAAVSGSGFVTLAATLAAVHSVPVAGMALLIGVERFMSEARAVTNLIGNGVATVVVARWNEALNVAQMRRVLAGERPAPEPRPDSAESAAAASAQAE
jgi:aerobic C4-dicarboxylate transport protein